ncbi:MAG: CRISPR-associated protein Csm5 [Methylovulum sp.]|nr:MAG: CRISPR-associated protein Csm5 [Methylovulum sp.]
MSFLQQYSLKFTPLSPVHIGANETYEPGNYVIDDETLALHGFDSHAALAGFDERDRQQLLAIVGGKPDDTMLTKVQAFFHNNREKLIAHANPAIPVAKGVGDLYRKRIGQTAQHEGGGRRVINKLEIERTFYNPVTGQPIFPGSSIKGAIRTALLDKINNGKRADRNERNQELQQRLLEGNFHTDPLRLVSLSDAHWHGDRNLPAQVVNFAVNRKRKPVLLNGHLVQSQAELSNLTQLLECVAPIAYQSLHGNLTLHNTDSVRHDKHKLPAEKFHWTMKDIAEACNRFYVHLFNQELQILKDRGYADTVWLNGVERLFDNGLLQQMNAGKVFLLRVGRHSGAEAMTLEGVRSIKIMKGRGEKPDYASQPKTIWLAADEADTKNTMKPFGWVLVEIDPQTENTDCVDWLEKSADRWVTWQTQQNIRQQTLRKQATERLLIEQQRQAEQQALVAAEQQRQLEEQQRLANLSPIDQEIEAFLKTVPEPEWDTRLLQELIKGRWQDEDCKAVARKIKDLMIAADKWMPDFTGSNKQKLKFKERSQKVSGFLDG